MGRYVPRRLRPAPRGSVVLVSTERIDAETAARAKAQWLAYRRRPVIVVDGTLFTVVPR